jgi:hypothetical protein
MVEVLNFKIYQSILQNPNDNLFMKNLLEYAIREIVEWRFVGMKIRVSMKKWSEEALKDSKFA